MFNVLSENDGRDKHCFNQTINYYLIVSIIRDIRFQFAFDLCVVIAWLMFCLGKVVFKGQMIVGNATDCQMII